MKGKIFNSEEVQAIIAGKKTMFRDVIMPQPVYRANCFWYRDFAYSVNSYNLFLEKVLQYSIYKIGQEIFVKEAFYEDFFSDTIYKQEGKDREEQFIKRNQLLCVKLPWKSPIHMKQEHSRLTLRIKSVKVERLQDISKDDAVADAPQYSVIDPLDYINPIDFFSFLWSDTHKNQEHKWSSNPWVFAYEFEIINLDK